MAKNLNLTNYIPTIGKLLLYIDHDEPSKNKILKDLRQCPFSFLKENRKQENKGRRNIFYIL